MAIEDNAFEYNKNDARVNQMEWVKAIPFLSYGAITEVINSTAVRVAPVVQETKSFRREVDVTLVGLSSPLFEVAIQPALGDLVLLISLNTFHPDMFDLPKLREKEIIVGEVNNGYTIGSFVGVLVSTMKSSSAIQAIVREEGAEVSASLKLEAIFGDSVSVGFTSPDGKTYDVNVTIGEARPVGVKLSSAFTLEAGFRNNEEKTPVDAPVSFTLSEKAPITFNSAAAITFILGEKAPVVVTTKSDMTITSEGALTATFGKPVSIKGASDPVEFGNANGILGELGIELLNVLDSFITVGSPATHKTGPQSKSKIAQLRQKWTKVFK